MKNKWHIRLLVGENGVSLLELMIVVLIISILVGMAIFTFRNTATVELRTCQANLRILDGAIVQYYLYEKDYPDSIDKLIPKYIKTRPKCPTDKTKNYEYDSENHNATCLNGHTYP